MLPSNDLQQKLIPYHGTRCEIDLLSCELLITQKEQTIRIALPTSIKREKPLLHSLGQSICLQNSQTGDINSLVPWEPDLKYGLILDPAGVFLLHPQDCFQKYLVQTQQLIYPYIYLRQMAQGPFDLFVSADQSLLAVVNRNEGHVLLVEPSSAQVIAQRQFVQFKGTKVLSVAVDSDLKQVWLCGLNDRSLWKWSYHNDQIEVVSGPWKTPGAVALNNGTLWILDSHQQTIVHGLNSQNLELTNRISIMGSSYAQQTDAPGDILSIDPQGNWLAVMTHTNIPNPLSANVSVIRLKDRSRDLTFQPTSHNWPVMLACAHKNKTLQDVSQRYSLNQTFENQDSPESHGLIKALLDSYELNLSQFKSKLLILEAQKKERDVHAPQMRELVYQQILKVLKVEHNINLPNIAQTPLQQELVVHAASLTQLLNHHDYLDVMLLQALGQYTLHLELDRQELLSQLSPLSPPSHLNSTSQNLQGLDVSLSETPQNEFIRSAPRPENWSCIADALNSRLIQLNQDFKIAWSLETTLFDVYRPTQVFWQENSFVVLDDERSVISSWTYLAKQEWFFANSKFEWQRFALFRKSQEKCLLLLDTDGKVFTANVETQELLPFGALEDISVRDICPYQQDQFFVLDQSGQLHLYSLNLGLIATYSLPGHASRMTLSPDGDSLALFDTQTQTLYVLYKGEIETVALQLDQTQYRISQIQDLHWYASENLLIYDTYRVLNVDIPTGSVQHHVLLQALLAEKLNLSPESIFAAKANRNLGIIGGTQTSLTEMFQRVPLFHDVSADFINELINHVQTQVFNQGDMVVSKGDDGKTMFLIRQGQVEVLDPQNKSVVARMTTGDVFGEVAIMLGLPRNASIRAAVYSELFVIQQSVLDELLMDYPDVKERLLQLAQDRHQQANLRSEAEQDRVKQRVQTLLAQRKNPIQVSKLGAARLVDSELSVSSTGGHEFNVWMRHVQACQLACVNREGKILRILGNQQGFVQPQAALETRHGLWVLDSALNSLSLLEDDRVRLQVQSWNQVQLMQPRALAETVDGSIWVANTGASELLLISSSGELLEQFKHGRAPVSVEVLENGHLLVADSRMHTVSELNSQGEMIWSYGTPRSFGREENKLFAPEHALRLANGHTLIADTGNSRVLELEPSGRIVGLIGSANGLRVIRPTYIQTFANGYTLLEHSNHFYWLELNAEQIQTWRYALPLKGFDLVDL